VAITRTIISTHIEVDGIRMATIEEIIAMKLEVIQGGGEKKDFGIYMNYFSLMVSNVRFTSTKISLLA
jgi:hypothetical protein